MAKINNCAGIASDRLLNTIEKDNPNHTGYGFASKNQSLMREVQRVKERAYRKQLIRAAKARQLKPSRGFA